MANKLSTRPLFCFIPGATDVHTSRFGKQTHYFPYSAKCTVLSLEDPPRNTMLQIGFRKNK